MVTRARDSSLKLLILLADSVQSTKGIHAGGTGIPITDFCTCVAQSERLAVIKLATNNNNTTNNKLNESSEDKNKPLFRSL
jgi:hypothetical protein